ncbi:MAG: serine hydrolase [Candidatus Berkiella sp.]
MGRWSENQEHMQPVVREEMIKSLWDKIQSIPSFDDKLKKFHILKAVLGLLKEENQRYVETERSESFNEAIREGNFKAFKQIVNDALNQSSYEKLKRNTPGRSDITQQEIDAESDKTLAEIQNGEHLSLPSVDNADPNITPDDIADLKEYMREMQISAAVSIVNNNQSYVIDHERFGRNPTFSIHSVAKVFTGVLLMKMIDDGIMSESDLDEPIQLDEAVLRALSPEVQQRLTEVSLKQIMLHESGLGDYLDNPSGLSASIEDNLNQHRTGSNITSSLDLVKYGDKSLGDRPAGQFHYSNLGMLLLGFAIEKKYQDAQRKRGELPLLGIDEIMQRFAKQEIKMAQLDPKRPADGKYNTTQQRNPQRQLLTNKDPKFIQDYVSSRFGCTAGGYWTTNEDLQKFGEWIKIACQKSPNFERLIKTHGDEFYNKDKQAVEHSGLHADTAHFYTSLRNGTVITVLSDQGERAATNLADMILKQTTWYKAISRPSPVTPAFQRSVEGSRTIGPALQSNKGVPEPSDVAKYKK